MRKTLAILLASITLVSATAAHADDWRHRGPRPGYNGGWVAPLVGGMIVGGIIGGAMASQPRYNDDYYYHTECRRERVFDQWGNFIGFERRCYRVPNQ
jgi:hypothetical protein